MKKMILITLTASLFFGFLAQAQEVQFGTMVYGGTGCPNGTQPNMQISHGLGQVIFQPYSVDLKGNLKAFERKACNIRLPISINAGFQVGVKLNNSKGFVNLEKKSTATVSTAISYVGSARQTQSKQFVGHIKNSYSIQNSLPVNYIWTGCTGRDALLSIDTSALATHPKASQAALVSIEEVNFEFVVRKCQQ